ncbi:MAG: tRNA (adenosine(37)-N6)-dimethylallyltransferase MiaA [Candidatus Chisholmbacteria bacterium RIFCSPLOWO2_01_FULL_50_28]|uniref:tRNA dimethylallyltransferase n=1 Tax=Candidatus Chisholmbacteria bacterium RIFCSPHIGHO2_01_FULL_52_32 TaxID=1797591 RepID=A0A1G1VTS2_9BACT|nr:MAG: tRNA (adenosine(37)-N6)-dimethylallyltransferase MiaA [Candidatus Chisholmbacteria bacterium RIFCSPHIGHO2_01_FULL_52_32]OGY19819.1 MAG: tRNA (adenosine(37)-N6)-dimethylallyltransferase MiaA [Candidatus Chisholmbacteria bacterium RIFCSPLOWO2_01_FULL_50_28]
MNRKLLIIAGPTATGKTSLALTLANKFNGELISADSRQVYIGMDLGTGKDLPKNLKPQTSKLMWRGKPIRYYSVGGVRIWGYDLVKPDEVFNAAFFEEIAWMVIKNTWRQGKLPVLVGGTGLYLKAVTEPLITLHIPPDKKLRRSVEQESVTELQHRLINLDKEHFNRMNNSDKQNKRRLVRAIELARNNTKVNKTLAGGEKETLLAETSILKIGLKAPKPLLDKRIGERVDVRIKQGAKNEVRQLIKQGYTFDLISMSGMGYRHWKPYFEGTTTREEVARRWKFDEHDYARRQLTWFKKDQAVRWYDITETNWQKRVVGLVREWYSKLIIR